MMEAINEYKFLRFIPFCELYNWSVQYMSSNRFGYADNYTLVKIGTFLSRNKTPIDIEDGKEYKRVTIKINNGGVFLRDKEKGENIGTKKQFIISKGQFLLSKIDARNGAFGVVPENLDGSIVTNDFPVFDINRKLINPTFLLLIITTKEFVNFAQSCSSGTTNRQRVDINLFLQQEVPLPSLDEQNQLISAYNQKLASAENLEKQATALENGIEAYLMEELGINISKTPIHNGLNFIPFSLITRWDVAFFTSTIRTKSKHKLATIGKCISYFMVDTNNISLRTETYKTPKQDFHYIGMESIEKSSGMLISLPLLKGSAIKSQTIQVPKDYFIYGKLRPYLNKYWINETKNDNIVCSSEFFVFCIKTDINKLYFKYVLASSIVQQQISDATSGARMPRINESIFKNVEIPLPPLPIQNEIANHISTEKEKIRNLKTCAEKLRKEALAEFEKIIFE